MTRKPPPSSRQASSLGGLTTAARLTPEELKARGERAAAVRWEKENERRAEEGLPPTKRTVKLLEGDARAYWLARTDERFGVDYPWANKMQRVRAAERMAREAAARLAADAFRNGGTA